MQAWSRCDQLNMRRKLSGVHSAAAQRSCQGVFQSVILIEVKPNVKASLISTRVHGYKLMVTGQPYLNHLYETDFQ